MLSESQIKQAKNLVFEYTQCNREIEATTDKLNKLDLKPEYKEQRWNELTGIEKRKQEIQATIQKEFGVDLQKLEDRTPLSIMTHIRKQEQNLERQLPPLSPDRPQELEKQPPQVLREIDPYKVEQERHNFQDKKTPEIEQVKQASDQTFTVTHPEQKLKRAIDRYLKAMEQHKHHEREQHLPRDHNSVKEKGRDR